VDANKAVKREPVPPISLESAFATGNDNTKSLASTNPFDDLDDFSPSTLVCGEYEAGARVSLTLPGHPEHGSTFWSASKASQPRGIEATAGRYQTAVEGLRQQQTAAGVSKLSQEQLPGVVG
jgi:hypothetical protein